MTTLVLCFNNNNWLQSIKYKEQKSLSPAVSSIRSCCGRHEFSLPHYCRVAAVCSKQTFHFHPPTVWVTIRTTTTTLSPQPSIYSKQTQDIEIFVSLNYRERESEKSAVAFVNRAAKQTLWILSFLTWCATKTSEMTLAKLAFKFSTETTNLTWK